MVDKEKSFNGLTPSESERLALLSEECGEVIQVIGKILRHGYKNTHPAGGDKNRKLLEKELGDIKAAAYMMNMAGDVDNIAISRFSVLKLKKINKYLHHQTQN